jgi:hypothetical protein
LKSFTAEDAGDAKEEKSLTAKDTKGAKEGAKLYREGAKSARTNTINSTPRVGNPYFGGGSEP